ncbi:TonB-dependent receptor [Chloracidobacterium validum]|uniref:TonB-dependent receptor n=1 Tax=Chloracidobacterium validum TaxID=2821543 RepID=A0ABX8BF76_9BACT|nr:TonB-dependent receptor [Chloracidobacterium validum]QUW04641.1 TonB-dependent receptor [Chloracidobacterium validum]
MRDVLRLKWLWLLTVAICLGIPGQAWAQAQATTGQIAGVVLDQTGASIANATVTAENVQTGFKQTTTSRANGEYVLVQLPVGNYNVTAEASNFTATTVENITVIVGRTFNLNLNLGVGAVTGEVIEVTASGVSIQTTRSEADAIQNSTAIQNLPINGRRFQDFVTLSPNAQVEPRRQQISLSGQRGIYGANVNVDGMDYNQPFFGGIRGGERSNSAFTIPQESIREFQVVSAGYSAEFGRSTGGTVNAVTKSGTNEFHGTAFYLIRPQEAARTNDFFRAQEAQFAQQGITGRINAAPTQQQFGGSVGGPIFKNKLFFFFAYEQQRLRQTRSTVFPNLALVNPGSLTPSQQAVFNFYSNEQGNFNQTNDAWAPLLRLDWQINSKNLLTVRYNFSFNRALNANSNGPQIFPTTNSSLANNGAERNRNNIGVVSLNTTLTSSLFNEFRFQFAREDRPRGSNSDRPTFNSFIGNVGAVAFLPTTQFDTRTQFVNNLTVIAGNHTMKFGFEYSRVFANQLFGFNQFGSYSLIGANTTLAVINGVQVPVVPSNAPPTAQRGRFDVPANYTVQIGNRFTEYTVHQLAFFGQDSWRIRPNFTLNYGLRWEGQYNPTPEANNTALVNIVNSVQYPIDAPGVRRDPTRIPDVTNQYAPRVGVAWDPFNNGKSVFRANGGIYYATTPLLLFADATNNFRTPPGNLSAQIPFALPAGFNQAAFDASPATAGYRAIMGTGAAPNTVFRQFLLAGINLNNFQLGALPTVTPAQLTQIANVLNQFLPTGATPFSLSAAATPLFIDGDFRNPRSLQANFGYEYQVARGLTLGVDFSLINTVYLQRNRQLNLPAPRINPDNIPGDISLRPIFNPTVAPFATRPNLGVGQLTVRESTARSLYRAMVLRAKFERRWGQFSAFYTLSDNRSDDDNEREAGGSFPSNSFDLRAERGFSNIDRRHLFVVNPVIFLPYGFEVSSVVRLQSAFPIDAIVGNIGGGSADVNRDGTLGAGAGGQLDRPFRAPGDPFPRNAFRNRPIYNVDLRIQKRFKITESQDVTISGEFFNLFNTMSLQYSGAAVTSLCNFAGLTGNALIAAQRNCGIPQANVPVNPNFLSLRDRNPNSARLGQLLLNNTLGNSVFQFQVGVRYQF